MSVKEQVNHPEHYNIEGRKECWDEFIERFGAKYTFVWCLMTAQKYLYRQGLKEDNPAEQDLNKAKAYFAKATSIRVIYREVDGYANGLYNKTLKDLSKYVKVKE